MRGIREQRGEKEVSCFACDDTDGKICTQRVSVLWGEMNEITFFR